MFPLFAQLWPELSLPLGGKLQLAAPLWLLSLILLPLIAWCRRRRPVSVLLIPFAAAWAAPRAPAARRLPVILASAALVCLTLALARPQRVDDRRIVRGEGYDLVIAIDLSTSMYAEDATLNGRTVNRLEALKPVLEAFIRRRPADRIGFVAFAGRAYTLAPLTHDHAWLGRQIARLRIGLIEDGTALGDGLGLALTRLAQARKESDASRAGAFIILMTDGANNRGTLTPKEATVLATNQKIPVHTLGVGREGIVPFPVFDQTTGQRLGTGQARSDLDEETLRDIAQATGGRFARAEDPGAADSAFDAIDRAQKATFAQSTYVLSTELFAIPAALACVLLVCAALLLRVPRPASTPQPAA